MSALYVMSYRGRADSGNGAIYVGRGTIAGVDVGNIRYSGSYHESDGRIIGTVEMHAASDAELVSGMRVPAGTRLPISIDWPMTFADGTPRTLSVAGHSVQVSLEKISDIP